MTFPPPPGDWLAVRQSVAGFFVGARHATTGAGKGKVQMSRHSRPPAPAPAPDIRAAAATLGRKGGQARTPAQQEARRRNGRKGGRPRTRSPVRGQTAPNEE